MGRIEGSPSGLPCNAGLSHSMTRTSPERPKSSLKRTSITMLRAIDLRGAIAINVISMVGIGPLITVPLVVAALHEHAIVAWLLGAVVAICDGLVYAELGSLYPGEGSTFVYLREAFGPERAGRFFAFLFIWQFVLSTPLVLASGYIGFASYAAYLA